jgi:predicted methyltransferase
MLGAVLLLAASCDKDTAETEPPPAATPEPVAEAPAEPTPEEKAAQEQAKLEKQLADRLAQLEKDAAQSAKRWTPQLQAKVTALAAKNHRNLRSALKQILASEHRAPGNRDRDQYRHPMETLAFFGLKPNMKVFEVGQGAGWYTEILAPLLAKKGQLYLATGNTEEDDPRAKFAVKATDLFIGSAGNLYEKVQLVPQQGGEAPPTLGEPESLDMVLVFRMMHNFEQFKLWDRYMPAIHAALGKGGVLAVVQHRAADDADVAESAKAGYLPTKWLVEKVESYGFELEKSSEVNANPKDTKDYPQGVWTLPPTLRLKDQDQDKYLAIGESDRATLKFVKK